MNPKILLSVALVLTVFFFYGCKQATEETAELSAMEEKVNEFVMVELSSDISFLSDREKEMLPILIKVAKIMDEIFWLQAFGNKEELLNNNEDEASREFIRINYGPWERLKDNEPFVEGYGKKPDGAGFYPADMTKEEFEVFVSEDKSGLYTVVRRNEDGTLKTVPYHIEYGDLTEKAVELIKQAAELADDPGLKKYLELRAVALLTDDYLESDLAWMDMKTNNIDFVVGPIENYEDGLFNYKAAHESFLLIKDKSWSEKLEKYAALLPALQKSLPVPDEYKTEVPGSDSDLGVYDAVYYAGDCNCGSKTIAISLPNDRRVHAEKGSRKLQLKNAMQYKFDKILVPMSKILINEDQQKHIKFDAFFENTMFHEISHGLGINNTINNKGSVREALKEQYSPLEEGKADVVGLYLITQLVEMREYEEKDLMDNYVTFIASIFRSIRFGSASSHGKANLIRFNYFIDKGAFKRDEETGTYSVDFEKMTLAINELANEILLIQGNGDYEAAKELVRVKAVTPEFLTKDLERISEAGIPRDLVFNQGPELLGL